MSDVNFAPPRADLEVSVPNFEAPPEVKKMIRNAVIAGCISAGFTLLITVFSVLVSPIFSSRWETLFDVALILGLVFGIYKYSRTCAIIMFAYFIFAKIYMIAINPGAGFPGLVLGAIFAYYYFLGIIGTFKFHKLKKAHNSTWSA